ncbi:MAG: nitronate monooxygenase, partial [Verrucomicrobiales bacterium]
GGGGAGVSNGRLARAVSPGGELGVVWGTALDAIAARRLQLGDPDGEMRRALSHFPWPEVARRVLERYFIPGGKAPGDSFKTTALASVGMAPSTVELIIVANFAEVFLAKEGHDGLVGINYLEKIQLPTFPSLIGAMLAGVDCVLMGAGIPMAIPGALDGLSSWQPVECKLHVEDNPDGHEFTYRFDPAQYLPGEHPPLSRPRFFAVVSSHVVAITLARKASGTVDGFVVENHTAGGHNAPPRRKSDPGADDSSPFGEKDIPNIEKVKELGKPFWLAGGFASPAKLKEALELGAAGIQVGTVFAYCEESGVTPEIKREVLNRCRDGTLCVSTDFQASPTGYPFKLISMEGEITTLDRSEGRKRVCDLGFLRQPYANGDSKVGYRCPGEPEEHYVKKGGRLEDTVGKQCLCNGLLATIGLGQERAEGAEPPIITAGEDFSAVAELMRTSDENYRARDVIDYLRDE